MYRIAIPTILVIIAGCKQGSELAGLAGEYYHGDGLGANCTLTLQDPNRFDFHWQSCLGTYDRNAGTARCIDKILFLKPSQPNIREGFQGTKTEFLAISWGSRQYLIPDDEMLNFCNAINQGIEPRSHAFGSFYMRSGDWDKPVKGKPELNGDWFEYLLDEPVRGEILRILDNGNVELNVGTEHGLLAGMTLTAQQAGDNMFSQLVVVESKPRSCRASVKYASMSNVSVGQPVSTRLVDSLED